MSLLSKPGYKTVAALHSRSQSWSLFPRRRCLQVLPEIKHLEYSARRQETLPSLRPKFPASTVSIPVTIILTLQKLYPHLCFTELLPQCNKIPQSLHGKAYMKSQQLQPSFPGCVIWTHWAVSGCKHWQFNSVLHIGIVFVSITYMCSFSLYSLGHPPEYTLLTPDSHFLIIKRSQMCKYESAVWYQVQESGVAKVASDQ